MLIWTFFFWGGMWNSCSKFLCTFQLPPVLWTLHGWRCSVFEKLKTKKFLTCYGTKTNNHNKAETSLRKWPRNCLCIMDPRLFITATLYWGTWILCTPLMVTYSATLCSITYDSVIAPRDSWHDLLLYCCFLKNITTCRSCQSGETLGYSSNYTVLSLELFGMYWVWTES
jgi:hypothetical protein